MILGPSVSAIHTLTADISQLLAQPLIGDVAAEDKAITVFGL
jgi:hypothetical protein